MNMAPLTTEQQFEEYFGKGPEALKLLVAGSCELALIRGCSPANIDKEEIMEYMIGKETKRRYGR